MAAVSAYNKIAESKAALTSVCVQQRQQSMLQAEVVNQLVEKVVKILEV